MPHIDNSSDSEGDAPESLSLSQSKAAAKKYDNIRLSTEATAKRKLKEKNKKMDEILKERSASNQKGKPGKKDDDQHRASKRVKLDTSEKEGQSSTERPLIEDKQGDDDVISDAEEEFEGFGAASQSSSASEEDENDSEDSGISNEDESASGTDSESDAVSEGERRQNSKGQSDYLPDHIFSSALLKLVSPATVNRNKKTKLKIGNEELHQSRRKKHRANKVKDTVIGSKTIRVVPSKKSHTSIAVGRTVPPGKVKKFFDDSLGLGSGRNKSLRGWERKTANIVSNRGCLLPARGFVRNS